MRVGLISDTHAGVRQDSVIFHDNMKRFYNECFFPYLKKNKIKRIIHLGDMLDNRKSTNTYSAQRLREDLLEPSQDFEIDAIVGNHDARFKNTIKTNAHNELILGKYEHINVIDEPSEVKYGDKIYLLLPWICDDNYDETMMHIKNTRSKVAFGHLELSGFEMTKGYIIDHGHDPDLFKKFDLVCSGHYHRRSKKGNIQYLGAAGEYRWDDYDCPRGFNIFDTDTNELEFVENPFRMFYKISYTDKHKNIDFSEYTGKYVRLYMPAGLSPAKYDTFVSKMQDANPHELIVDDEKITIEEGSVDIEVEDTRTIFRNYIQSMDNVDVPKLTNFIDGLYNEAMQVE